MTVELGTKMISFRGTFVSVALTFLAHSNAFASMTQSGTLTVTQSVTSSSITLTGVGATVYSLTTSSGIHVLGGKVKLDPGAFIQWPDGTISDSASMFAGFNSTWTRYSTQSSATSMGWQPIAGSTLTLNMGNRHALIGFSCPVVSSAAVTVGVLVNGNFIDGETGGDNGLGFNRSTGGGQFFIGMGGFVHLTQNTYSGSTAFSLIFRRDASEPAYLNWGGRSVCQFFVSEI